MSILEAISPTARLLLGNSGGGIVNSITKSTKTGLHRVHAVNANHAPICGGGNSARSAQWQEVIIEPDCRRCLKILEFRNKRKEQNANRDQTLSSIGAAR